MNTENKSYQELFSELTQYEKSGVRMQIDGISASPLQIVSAHMIRENCNYMRDYIMNEEGKITELDFHEVGKEKREESQRKDAPRPIRIQNVNS